MKRKLAQVKSTGPAGGPLADETNKKKVVQQQPPVQRTQQHEARSSGAAQKAGGPTSKKLPVPPPPEAQTSEGDALTKSQKKRLRKKNKKHHAAADPSLAQEAAVEERSSLRTGTPEVTKNAAAVPSSSSAGPQKALSQTNKQKGKTVQAPAPSSAKPSVAAATELFGSPERCLQWLVGPSMKLNRFFAEHWEKKPLLVKAKDRQAGGLTSGLFSFSTFEHLIASSTRPLFYTQHLNVCRYEDGEKRMLNPEGQAKLKEVRKFWREGCTFQFFQPQQHSETLHRMIAGLEQYFGALVGANIYMTPPNAQGLAPHYDDVEVFILQLEGKKKWKLYTPPPSDELPREYSRDLDQEECGEPTMELELEEGDMLYFPRGTIHQACTGTSASTHITISTYQRHSWGDFLATALPLAIKEAMEEDVEFRRGLPTDYLSYMGAAFAPDAEPEHVQKGKGQTKSAAQSLSNKQKQFEAKVVSLLHRLSGHLLLHKAADVMSLDFVNHRLPPPSLCYPENSGKDSNKGEQVPQELADGSSIRLVEPRYIRLVVTTVEDEEAEQDAMIADEEEDASSDADELQSTGKGKEKARGRGSDEDEEDEDGADEDEDEDEGDDDDDDDEGSVLLYHSLQNPAELHMSGHKNEPNLLRFPLVFLPALKHLVATYPTYVPLSSLPGVDPEQAIQLAVTLSVEGLMEIDNSK